MNIKSVWILRDTSQPSTTEAGSRLNPGAYFGYVSAIERQLSKQCKKDEIVTRYGNGGDSGMAVALILSNKGDATTAVLDFKTAAEIVAKNKGPTYRLSDQIENLPPFMTLEL